MSKAGCIVPNEGRLAISQGGGHTRDAAGGRELAKLSLFAAYAGGEAYSIYAVFVAHGLQPVTFYLSEQNPLRRAISGRYVEVFHPDGLIPTMVVSLIVFVSIWCLFRGVARTLSKQVNEDPELSSELYLKTAVRSRTGYRVPEHFSALCTADLKTVVPQFYPERISNMDAFGSPTRRSGNSVRFEEGNV